MDQALQRRLIEAIAEIVISHADELTDLDRQIGDGDHGLNMKRGFEAVLADERTFAADKLSDTLKAVGTTLVMKVGGASGPLYGTLFLTLAKELSADLSAGAAARAFAAAVQAVQARGKSQVGQKTMIDVLSPVSDELAAGGDDLARRVKARAIEAADATVPMKAIRGRASFLGDRSIGHMDPGARSASLMVSAVCDVLGGQDRV